MITITDRAYAAGVLDSDGSLGIYYANGKTTKSQITIAVQDMELLEWFQERWGGRIENNGRGQRVNKWVVGNAQERIDFLTDVLQFLHTKRDIAELVLQYLTVSPRPHTNEEYTVLTKAYNRRLSESFVPHPAKVKESSTDSQGGE